MVTGIGTMQSTAPTIMNGNVAVVEPVKRANDNRRVSTIYVVLERENSYKNDPTDIDKTLAAVFI